MLCQDELERVGQELGAAELSLSTLHPLLTKGTHRLCSLSMSGFDWSDTKNQFLKSARGVSFEDVVFHIQNGDVLDVIRHPNRTRYPDQNMIVLNMEGYVYLVPYVKERGTRFLKTIVPSRKATREYL